jgi:hypothetical protein
VRGGHTEGMNSGVYPPYKTKYRVANWASYDRALVDRGDVTLWVSAEAVATWAPAGVGTRGGALSVRSDASADHVIVANEAGLRRVLAGYVAYYMRSRTHSRSRKTARWLGPSNRHRPDASYRLRKSEACTTATIASQRSRRRLLPI